MQQTEQISSRTVEPTLAGRSGAERKRVEMVVETLATAHSKGETVAEVAHDARNMVAALGLYCDLLGEPGVLAPRYAHYGDELRLVTAASRMLVEKLVALDGTGQAQPSFRRGDSPDNRHWPLLLPPILPSGPPSVSVSQKTAIRMPRVAAMVTNLATDLKATRNLLAALAGVTIPVIVDIEGCGLPARITSEDLTRVLVNLVRNAVEAMPDGGRIDITLREIPAGWMALTVQDNGPGIPADALEKVFVSGYTGHADASARGRAPRRGLGLAITRSIVAAAGGRIYAENHAPRGARFVIELPVIQESGTRD